MYDFDAILSNNNDLITKVDKYLKDTLKLDTEQILKAPRDSVKNLLYKVSKINYDIEDMRRTRTRMQEDLEILDKASVISVSYDGVRSGENNGQHSNPTETRYWQILKMREDIEQMTYDILLAEKTFIEIKKMIRDFIYLIPQPQYARIIEATYFERSDDMHIAIELNYTYETIRKSRVIGLKELGTLIKLKNL